MNSENKFTIIGRLTKDPILRETEKGTKVTNICVACEREYKGKDGNKIVDFLDFTLWDKNAENICNITYIFTFKSTFDSESKKTPSLSCLRVKIY